MVTHCLDCRKKLQKAKELIKPWAQSQGHSSKRVDKTRRALDMVSSELLVSPSSVDLQSRVKDLQMELKVRSNDEEADLRQRSKVNWLKLGDSNSNFFSLATKVRRSANSTLRLLNSEGMPNVTRE